MIVTMTPAVFKFSEPDPMGLILQTRMQRFNAHAGIEGLARYNGHGMIELLAVATREKQKGQFRRFVADLKAHYQTICVWHVENPILAEALVRYGFKPELTVDEFGDPLDGFRWDALSAAIPGQP